MGNEYRKPKRSRIEMPMPGSVGGMRSGGLDNITDKLPLHFNVSGPLVRILYAQYDPKIKFLGNEPDQQEKLITIMEISGNGISDDRIATLEKRVREMEAQVKGLIEELLDIKSISMTMSRQTDESCRQEFKRESVVPGTASLVLEDPSASPSVADPSDGITVIQPKGASQPDVPAEPAMARIMQSDGTMKLEPRRGGSTPIDSSAGYGRTRRGTSVKGKQVPLIYAADEDKSNPEKK